MSNTLIKIGFLVIGICIVWMLFNIGSDRNRFQMSADGSTFLDTQTNEVYLLINYGMKKHSWFKMDNSGKNIEVKGLPN